MLAGKCRNILCTVLFAAVLFLSPLISYAQSNLGKNFRVTENYIGGPDFRRFIHDYPESFLLILSPHQTTATVKFEGAASFQVNLNSYWTRIVIPDSISLNFKAIYITSQDSIAVFPIIDVDGSVGVYPLMPIEQWGTRYIIPTRAFDMVNYLYDMGYFSSRI